MKQGIHTVILNDGTMIETTSASHINMLFVNQIEFDETPYTVETFVEAMLEHLSPRTAQCVLRHYANKLDHLI
jgi:hypothetical protein